MSLGHPPSVCACIVHGSPHRISSDGRAAGGAGQRFSRPVHVGGRRYTSPHIPRPSAHEPFRPIVLEGSEERTPSACLRSAWPPAHPGLNSLLLRHLSRPTSLPRPRRL